MRHRQLPEDLRDRVRRYEQYKWLAARGVDEEVLLQSLPTDLRRDIQRHLCLDLVRRVSFSVVLVRPAGLGISSNSVWLGRFNINLSKLVQYKVRLGIWLVLFLKILPKFLIWLCWFNFVNISDKFG